MTKSNMQAIVESREQLRTIFDCVEYPLLSATEENFDAFKALGQKLKRLLFQDDLGTYSIVKLDNNNKPCHSPHLSPEDLSSAEVIPEIFLYLDICSLKNRVEFISKKKFSGLYYKYKDWHFLVLQSKTSAAATSPTVYRVITVPPLKGRKPFEVTPYDILRSDLH